MGQFSALLVKNWILYKRGWVGSVFEILIPVMFVGMVMAVKNLVEINNYPETQFVGVNMTINIPNNVTMWPQAIK